LIGNKKCAKIHPKNDLKNKNFLTIKNRLFKNKLKIFLSMSCNTTLPKME